MSEQVRTHRELRAPQITGRFLADYMAATDRARRTIVRNCKYQPIARVVQHDEAKQAVARHLRGGGGIEIDGLKSQATALRQRFTDSQFERDLCDHNADYIERYADCCSWISLPEADVLAPGKATPINLHGVKVSAEIHLRLQRTTRTNKVRVGALMLRYAKGKALEPEVGLWQSAFLYGYLRLVGAEPGTDVEGKLCLTLDCYCGAMFEAPGNSNSRFQNMSAACATIAEQWPNIPPPPGAIL